MDENRAVDERAELPVGFTMRRGKNGHTITDVTGRDRASGHRRPADAIAHAWQLHDGPPTAEPAEAEPVTFDQALTVQLAPGTTVILSATREITEQQLDELHRQWEARFPDNPLVVLDGFTFDGILAAAEDTP